MDGSGDFCQRWLIGNGVGVRSSRRDFGQNDVQSTVSSVSAACLSQALTATGGHSGGPLASKLGREASPRDPCPSPKLQLQQTATD
jgi:hypothetical protein